MKAVKMMQISWILVLLYFNFFGRPESPFNQSALCLSEFTHITQWTYPVKIYWYLMSARSCAGSEDTTVTKQTQSLVSPTETLAHGTRTQTNQPRYKLFQRAISDTKKIIEQKISGNDQIPSGGGRRHFWEVRYDSWEGTCHGEFWRNIPGEWTACVMTLKLGITSENLKKWK